MTFRWNIAASAQCRCVLQEMVANSVPGRGRRVGADLLAGARYRYCFSPCRYMNLPLAVIEAMTIGVPSVALATTQVATAPRNGVHGHISNDIDKLAGQVCNDFAPTLAMPLNWAPICDSSRDHGSHYSGFFDDWQRFLGEVATGA